MVRSRGLRAVTITLVASTWFLGMAVAQPAPPNANKPIALPEPAPALPVPAPIPLVPVPAPLVVPPAAEAVPAPPADSSAPLRFVTGAPPPVPGLFAEMEAALVFPRFGFALGAASSAYSDTLDANVSPTVTLGYRSPNGLHALYAAYRYLGAAADFNDEVRPGRARLDLNDFDFLYQGPLGECGQNLRLYWESGSRLSSIYYDRITHVPTLDPTFLEGPTDIHTVSRFIGAGPEFGVGGSYRTVGGLSLFSQLDFAALFGQFSVGDATSGGRLNGCGTMDVLRVKTGLEWVPAYYNRFAVQGGYRFEQEWGFARDSIPSDVTIHGLFASCRFIY